MRPEIAQKGVAYTSKAVCPRFQAGYMVYTDAQNLGIQSHPLCLISFVRWDLACSDRRPCQGEECQDDIGPFEIAQGDSSIQVAGQSKIWDALSNWWFHSFSSNSAVFNINIETGQSTRILYNRINTSSSRLIEENSSCYTEDEKDLPPCLVS